jgi:hypothetical protein
VPGRPPARPHPSCLPTERAGRIALEKRAPWNSTKYWKLLREGQAIARELPTAGWSAYARGVLAENLGLIDVDAALALMKDFKDPFQFLRHHGNLARRLAGVDPAAAAVGDSTDER